MEPVSLALDEGGSMVEVSEVVGGLVPRLVEQLIAAHPGRVYREALAMLEKPLLVHALRLTGGSQLRAARLPGVNRNPLPKRCPGLGLATTPTPAPVAPQ